jgi:hypothetical protein
MVTLTKEELDIRFKFVVQLPGAGDDVIRVRMFFHRGSQGPQNFVGTFVFNFQGYVAFKSRFPEATFEEVRWFKGLG